MYLPIPDVSFFSHFRKNNSLRLVQYLRFLSLCGRSYIWIGLLHFLLSPSFCCTTTITFVEQQWKQCNCMVYLILNLMFVSLGSCAFRTCALIMSVRESVVVCVSELSFMPATLSTALQWSDRMASNQTVTINECIRYIIYECINPSHVYAMPVCVVGVRPHTGRHDPLGGGGNPPPALLHDASAVTGMREISLHHTYCMYPYT